ncbi:MAG: hypothetical protein AAF944_04235 [Bacteroidota bacterium]
MKIRIKGFRRLLIESALIVFSVLFALFINRYAENQKTERQKEVALERIVEEMKDNRRILDSVVQIHRTALGNLQKASANERDSFRVHLAKQGYFDPDAFGLLFNNSSFLPEIPKSTSWNAAATIGIISEFDYDIVTAANEAYTVQRFLTEEMITPIIEIFYAPVDDEIKTINILSVQIRELISTEQSTITEINQALKIIYPDTEEEDQ